MRKKVTLAGFLLFFVIFLGIPSQKGKVFAQTLPFTYIKPPASNISLFIVADPTDAPEAEALILSLGGTIVFTSISDFLFPSTTGPGPGVIYIKAAGLPPNAFFELPPPGYVQFTAVFPDPYEAYSILWSSSSVYLLGIIISHFYGSATGLIKPIGGSLDMQGTHLLVDEVTGNTICKLSSADRLLLDNYLGALVGPVTVSGEFAPVINFHSPYFIMKVEDISLPSGLSPRSNILPPFLTGFGSLPFLNSLPFLSSILNQPFNFINPGSGWGPNFMPSSIQFMPSSWPGIMPWNGVFGGWMPPPILPYGLPFPYLYPFIGYGWPDFNSPPSDLDHSDWIWTNPTTAYNPNTPPGIQQVVLTMWAQGYEQESPYYQQNFDEIYSPAYVPGIGTVYPYQSISNPLSPTGFSTLIPDYCWWPNISLGGFFL